MRIKFGTYLLHSFSDICLYLIIAAQNSELNNTKLSLLFYGVAILAVVSLFVNVVDYIDNKGK